MLTEGRGLPPYTRLYVTSRSINMFPRCPLDLHLFLSLLLPSTSAQWSIHLMQSPLLRCSRSPRISRLPYPVSLFPPSPAAQVMSFFFSWIPLPSPASPSSHSLLRFPLAADSSPCSIRPRRLLSPRLGRGRRNTGVRCER